MNCELYPSDIYDIIKLFRRISISVELRMYLEIFKAFANSKLMSMLLMKPETALLLDVILVEPQNKSESV